MKRHRGLPIPAPSDLLVPPVALAAAVALVLLGVLAAVADHALLAWDIPVREAVRSLDAPSFGELMRTGTRLGDRRLLAPATILAALLVRRRCPQLAAVLPVAFLASLALELVLKGVVERPRPPLGRGFGASFPSGHVLAAVAFWGLVPPWSYLITGRRRLWASSAALSGMAMVVVGTSRVWLGAHWPSDVVGGYLVGAIFLLAAEWAIRRPWARFGCESCRLHRAPGPPGAHT